MRSICDTITINLSLLLEKPTQSGDQPNIPVRNNTSGKSENPAKALTSTEEHILRSEGGS